MQLIDLPASFICNSSSEKPYNDRFAFCDDATGKVVVKNFFDTFSFFCTSNLLDIF